MIWAKIVDAPLWLKVDVMALSTSWWESKGECWRLACSWKVEEVSLL